MELKKDLLQGILPWGYVLSYTIADWLQPHIFIGNAWTSNFA
jgi:hypothetical protein